MQGQQERLFDDENLTPFRDMYFPPDLKEGLATLFEAEIRLGSTRRSSGGGVCPYKNGDVRFNIPVTLVCDCPKSLDLVQGLGQRYPKCTQNRCPVRAIITA